MISPALNTTLQLSVRRSYFILGVAGAISFAAIGTWSVVVAAWNIDGSFLYPIPTAVFFGVFWGAWLFLSLYMVAASRQEKLTVTSQSITHVGVFQSRSIAMSDVTSAKWRTWPAGGSIVIRSPHSRIKIHFDSFVTDERHELISRLRELISGDCQNNWDVFTNSQQAILTHPPRSRSTGIICMVLFLFAAAVFVYCWHSRFGLPFLAVGVACSIVSVWYLFRIIRFAPDSDSESIA